MENIHCSFRSPPRKRGPRANCTDLSRLGPRFRGDERRLLFGPHSHIQLSNSVEGCCIQAKEYRPLFCCWARGFARLPPSSFPSNRGGRRADKAQCPDYSGRVVRITPDDEVHFRCTSRLAARQRGILAFMPLTVVGPGRLLVAGEAARVRPGDEVASSIARRCRSRSPLTRRLMKAPLEEWIGIGRSIITLQVKSSIIFTEK